MLGIDEQQRWVTGETMLRPAPSDTARARKLAARLLFLTGKVLQAAEAGVTPLRRSYVAAAFVHQSIAAMPVPFEATLVVGGPLAEVRSLIRYADARTDAIDDATCRVVLRSDTRAWLATVITLLASEYDVTIAEPADLLPEVRRFGARLRRVSATA